MRTYEALIIFKPFIDVDNSEALIKNVEALVNTLKGKVVKIERAGRKRLAFEIAKLKDGFIVTFYLQLPAEAIVEFKKACQINEDILRLTLINLNGVDVAIASSPASEPVRRGGGRFQGGDRGGFRGGDRGGFRGGDRPHHGDRPGFGDRGPRPPFNRPPVEQQAPAAAAPASDES